MAKKKSRSRKSWGMFLIFWALLLLLLGSLVCFFLNRFAERYEQWLPEKIVDGLMEQMSTDDWHRTLRAALPDKSEYEDTAALFDDYFSSAVASSPLAYRRDLAESDDTQLSFVVYAGTAKLGRVRLVRTDTPPFWKAKEWKLDSIEAIPLSESLQAVTVQVDAPDGEAVYLNGVALRREQIIDPAVPMEDTSALEQRFLVQPRLVRYSAGPLYGAIAVTDAEGTEIAPREAISNGLVQYVIRPRETYSLRVEAPEGMSVTVCGAELGADELVNRESIIFRNLDGYLSGQTYETLHYAADGLYTRPEIRASLNGAELESVINENGKVYFFYPTDPNTTQEMRSAAEGFFDDYVRFTAYKFNSVALNNLRSRILPGTELASYVNNSYDAMIWASATQVEYDELRFDNYHFVGEDCFTCTIRFKADYTAQQWNEQVSYAMQDGFKMVFIRSGGRWLAASMSSFD